MFGGIQKFSLVDYPGRTSAVLFVAGCNMRCGYCHNPELVLPELFAEKLNLSEIYEFLEKRRFQLDGIVITGGEPTLRKDLPNLCKKIKSMGFLLKLDTNGTNPTMLTELIDEHLIDYVAMDVKGPLDRYSEVTNRTINTQDIIKSIQVILSSGIQHEFRTTVVKEQLSSGDFKKIGKMVKGAQLYYLQRFVPAKTLDPTFSQRTPSDDGEMGRAKAIMEEYVDVCRIR